MTGHSKDGCRNTKRIAAERVARSPLPGDVSGAIVVPKDHLPFLVKGLRPSDEPCGSHANFIEEHLHMPGEAGGEGESLEGRRKPASQHSVSEGYVNERG
jgi:hypothetical protein